MIIKKTNVWNSFWAAILRWQADGAGGYIRDGIYSTDWNCIKWWGNLIKNVWQTLNRSYI